MPVFKLEKYSSVVPGQQAKDQKNADVASKEEEKENASDPVITIKGTLAETVYDSIVALFSNYNKPQDVTVIATDENNISKDTKDVKLSQESLGYTIIYMPKKTPIKKTLCKESINAIDRHLRHIVFSHAGLEAFIKRIG